VTLESKLEARDKEVQQLTRALEKSDEHISNLEDELQAYRAQVNSASYPQQGAATTSSVDGSVDIAATSLSSEPSEDTQTTEPLGNVGPAAAQVNSASYPKQRGSSFSSIIHEPSSTACTTSGDSCRKKLRFTSDSRS